MKKTITLCDRSGNPIITILRGHVTATEYNKAFKAEGWSSDWIYRENLRHEYWIKLKRAWKKSDQKNKSSVQVTVSDW